MNKKEIKQVEEARELLKSKGYYMDNLWTIDDVKNQYECTDIEAMGILDKVLQSEWLVSNIFEMISDYAEKNNLKPKEE